MTKGWGGLIFIMFIKKKPARVYSSFANNDRFLLIRDGLKSEVHENYILMPPFFFLKQNLHFNGLCRTFKICLDR